MNKKPSKRTRFAIYARYSSEMQNDLSIEAQVERCTEEIGKRQGVVVATYVDTAKSGWSLDRPGFNEMRTAAERKRFDSVMFWKFDRLARNHEHAVMIKMLLRHDYGVTLHCVEGFSEDDDDSAMGSLMEQMLAVIAAYYSKNLSSETKRGKRHRAINGKFNGSKPPLGYVLVKNGDLTAGLEPGLHISADIAPIIEEAFQLYASGRNSDRDVANWLNRQEAIALLRQGEKPVGKEMVRDLLQNRTYTGRVCYSETLYSGSLGQGKKSTRHRKEWFEGKHDAIVDDELFEVCQQVRRKNTKYKKTDNVMRTYLLHDRVYCAHCLVNKPKGLNDDNYGKMRPSWMRRDSVGYYRCLSHHRGYDRCGQRFAKVQKLDEQVTSALFSLTIPHGLKDRVEAAVQSRIENENALLRMEEIKGIMDRMDVRWDKGFYTSEEEYFVVREQLRREIDALRPVDYDELLEAADLIENVRGYWEKCELTENPAEARRQLVQKIVERVYVYEGRTVGISLHGNYGIVLNQDQHAPSEVIEAIELETKKAGNITENVSSQNGSDGI